MVALDMEGTALLRKTKSKCHLLRGQQCAFGGIATKVVKLFPGGLRAGSGPTRWCQLATQGLFYRESNMFPICEACSVKCVHFGICPMYCLGKRAR